MMPLEGVRVLDLSRLAPGPFCSMLLADLGADVLLIEAPPEALPSGGALSFIGRARGEEADRAQAASVLGRNKRSVVLNLRHDEARQVFYRLAGSADVVLEGFRPGVVRRLGVDYDTLSARNPRLVYCSLSGYGQDGPYASRVGHDINYISVAGALAMMAPPGQAPVIPLNLLADFAGGGLHAAFAILAALIARQTTNRGQYVDVAMSDGVLYLLAAAVGQYFYNGTVPKSREYLLTGGVAHYDVYETKDGRWISIGSLEPHFFANLCRALDCEEFIPHQYDAARQPEMAARFRQQFLSRTGAEWLQALSALDVCVAPVYTLDEALTDPHNLARDMVIEVEHPRLGAVKQVGIGPKFSDTPGRVRSTAPHPGQHTDEVLASLGYTKDEVAALREKGAVA